MALGHRNYSVFSFQLVNVFYDLRNAFCLSLEENLKRKWYLQYFFMFISGIVSNEVTLGIPCHVTDLVHFRDQLESLTSEYGILIRTELTTSADEMELFGAVNRHFKGLFNRQIECQTFYQYDSPPEGDSSFILLIMNDFH